jgi:hypothetical protein
MLVRICVDADKTTFGVTDNDFSSNLLSNWSVQDHCSLFGKTTRNYQRLKAYQQKFKDGFKSCVG